MKQCVDIEMSEKDNEFHQKVLYWLIMAGQMFEGEFNTGDEDDEKSSKEIKDLIKEYIKIYNLESNDLYELLK